MAGRAAGSEPTAPITTGSGSPLGWRIQSSRRGSTMSADQPDAGWNLVSRWKMWSVAPPTTRATSLPVLDGLCCSWRWSSTCTASRVSTGGKASHVHQRGGSLHRGQRTVPARTTLRPTAMPTSVPRAADGAGLLHQRHRLFCGRLPHPGQHATRCLQHSHDHGEAWRENRHSIQPHGLRRPRGSREEGNGRTEAR